MAFGHVGEHEAIDEPLVAPRRVMVPLALTLTLTLALTLTLPWALAPRFSCHEFTLGLQKAAHEPQSFHDCRGYFLFERCGLLSWGFIHV